MFKYQKSSFVNWIAVIAMAMGSLSPAISQAVAESQGFKVEICTVMGTKMISVTDDADTKQDLSKSTCPFCLSHSSYVLPSTTTPNLAEPAVFSFYPQLFYKSPKPLTTWITPPNQAPPELT